MGKGLSPRIRACVESFGLRVSERDWPCWQGPGIVCADTDSDLAHEAAHWIVAPPSRKGLKWHGLPFFESGPVRVKYPAADREEEMASILGILIERATGSDYLWTFNEHSWFGAPSKAARTIRRLRKRGLYPTCLGVDLKRRRTA